MASDPGAFDRAVRLAIYEEFIDTAHAPRPDGAREALPRVAAAAGHQ
jgi:hypothetical protein